MKHRALLALFFAFALALPFAFSAPAPAAEAQVPKPTCTLSAATGVVNIGNTVNLTWSSQGATGGTITTLGAVGPSGRQGVIPTPPSTTYVGTFSGPGGTVQCSTQVFVGTGVGSGSGSLDSTGALDSSGSLGSPPTQPLPTGSPTPAGGQPVVPTPSAPTAQAGTFALVPCSGTDCQACNIAQLAQSIINWLVGISIPLAALMFAFAGALYFTSSVTNQIERAKKIFKTVFLGFIIVIGAWLIVQTLLKTILVQSFYQNWNSIQCVNNAARPINTNIGQLFSSLPGLSAINGSPITTNTSPASYVNTVFNSGSFTSGSPTCGSGSTLNVDPTDSSAVACVNNTTLAVTDPTYVYSNTGSGLGNSGAGTAQWAQALADACSQNSLSPDQCSFSQAIMANESSGKSGVVSPAGCVGLMQVCPATACSLDSSISGCASGDYASVAQALKDPNVNMTLGTQYINQLSGICNGDYTCMAAAYNGGPGALKPSQTCPGQTYWQCSSNSGYAETRVYVPKVLNTYNKLSQ